MRLAIGIAIISACALGCLDYHDQAAEQQQQVAAKSAGGIEDMPTIMIAVELARRGILRWGCHDQGPLRLSWSPPDDGAPVVRYQLHLETHGHVWGDTTAIWPVPTWGDSARARVRGVAADGQVGPWGDWGEWQHGG